jgi:hypothetical protein
MPEPALHEALRLRPTGRYARSNSLPENSSETLATADAPRAVCAQTAVAIHEVVAYRTRSLLVPLARRR